MPRSSSPPPPFADPDAVRQLRRALAAAPFTVDGLESLWGPLAAAALERGDAVPARRALERMPSTTATVLARLFVLGDRVPRHELASAADPTSVPAPDPEPGPEADPKDEPENDPEDDPGHDLASAADPTCVPAPGPDPVPDPEPDPDPDPNPDPTSLPALVALLERVGLARTDGADLVPLVDLRPYSFVDAAGVGSWWIASDRGESATSGALPEDHVLGVGGASTTLAGLLVSRRVRSALDLGTGCGIQALHLSRVADRVVATDISERAIAFARFTAELNGIHRIDFRVGDLFAPVAGERFDRIVSNPPFVITPRRPGVPSYDYRDAGLEGDALVETVIARVADHLEEGGTAQLLGNWEYRADADGLDRVRGWIERTGLDGWVVERELQDAAQYAETWVRDGGERPGTPASDRLIAEWLDDFERRGVERVGFGYVTLRRGSAGLVRVERMPGPLATGAGLGDRLDAAFAAADRLAALDDAALLAQRPRVAGDITEERHYWPGDEHPTVITLRQGGGFARTVDADTALAALVGACDGQLSIAAIVAALAQLLEADEEALRGELLPRVRELVLLGVLDLSAPVAPGRSA